MFEQWRTVYGKVLQIEKEQRDLEDQFFIGFCGFFGGVVCWRCRSLGDTWNVACIIN